VVLAGVLLLLLLAGALYVLLSDEERLGAEEVLLSGAL
jgi:hypothetical protein